MGWGRSCELVCRGLLGAAFITAAAGKLLDLPRFADQLIVHQVLPPSLARVAAVFVPWLELTCGFCLAFNAARREAAVVLAVLLVAFTVYQLLRPVHSDCGCSFFGPNWPVPEPSWLPAVRNLVLLACAAVVIGRKGDNGQGKV